MTIEFTDNQLTYDYFINGDFNNIDRIVFKSLYSNTNIIDVDATVIVSNARYTQLEFTLNELIGATHQNGIYKYEVYDGSAILASGAVKITTNPGGGTGTEEYISNNEKREGQVYFRPQYEQ